MLNGYARPGLRLVLLVFLGLGVLLVPSASTSSRFGATKIAGAAAPTVKISALPSTIKPDARPFGILVDPIHHLTDNSEFFFRTPEGLAALKELGVKTLVYMVDRNNWEELYDDYTAEPQTYPSVMAPQEIVSVAKAIGAELIPMLNITLQCKRADPNLPYSSENVKCKHAKPKDAAAFVTWLKNETDQQGVPFARVIMGVEPYAGCAYWTSPKGVNCVMGNPSGRHQIRLQPGVYAERIVKWADKIHQTNPDILVGAHLHPTTPCTSNCSREWNEVVLEDAGRSIDFAVVHQYFRIKESQVLDEDLAHRLSYYVNQADINLRKVGRSGMPKEMRKDVLAWAPANKKDMPIWYAEFNAAYTDKIYGEQAAQIRRALYSGMSVGEMYLDVLSPTKVDKVLHPGGARAFLHHLFAEPTFIGSYQYGTMVFTPGWRVLETLKPFANRQWLQSKVKGVAKNNHGNSLVLSYAVRKGRKVTVALFNHSPGENIVVNIKLDAMEVKKANLTRVGESAPSLLSQNDHLTPDLILPLTESFPSTKIKRWGLSELSLAPHSLTLVEIKLK